MRNTRSNLRFLSDLAKTAAGSVGSLSDVRAMVKGLVKDRMDDFMSQTDMVSRDEFERVEAMATKARIRQEELEKRLNDLEKTFKSKPKTAAKKKTTTKTKAKTTTKTRKKK